MKRVQNKEQENPSMTFRSKMLHRMSFQRLSCIAAVGALLFGFTAVDPVKAAPNATITATLTSVGALAATNVADMNFGTWFLVPGAGSIDLVKATTGGITANVSGGATATQVVTNSTPAQVTVAITGGGASENGTVVHVTRGAITDFASAPDATLGSITYRTATQSGENALAEATPENVTIVAGNTPEPVYFGGTVTVTNTLPNGADTATFDVTFSY
jgi:hypothetical protein